MREENIDQEFRLKEIGKKRNYFTEETKQIKVISKKHKKICNVLNHTEHLLFLASTFIEHVSISTLVSSIGISLGIASSSITIKISVTL